ncbi:MULTISPECIES: GspE/PulE family protein [Vibrio]|uniref:Type II secretion protein n=1 Tax=Vibrio splendidus TaxID=29497 RepID=A0A2N7JJ95_VIBSP|nr:ATPase, T2SS/T4P/T4SS family [Vibrio splendidus]PMM40557.1 type II secretion protein [Vibrio splendidus]
MNIELTTDKALLTLCLEDGHSIVDKQGHIYADRPETPKSDAIRTYLMTHSDGMGKAKGWVPNRYLIERETLTSYLDSMQALFLEKGVEVNSSVGERLTALCQSAVNHGASDIHLEVHRNQTRILLRVDGKREPLLVLSNGESAQRLTSAAGHQLGSYLFQILGKNNFSVRTPMNDRFELSLKIKERVQSVEWRAALMPLDRGFKLVLRCLTSLGQSLTLKGMDLLPMHIQVLKEKVARRSGIVILTGPMGSGKSSLMFALLETIDRTARCVHSLEDPVEFEQTMVTKTLVEPKRELKEGAGVYLDYTFYAHEQLRQDIDVTTFGELRRADTVKEFVRKGETGGLAMSTLHANSAVGVPAIFIEQLDVPASVVASPGLMQLFTHQKLVRALCDCKCAAFDERTRGLYDQANQGEVYKRKIKQLKRVLGEQAHHAYITHPKGCEHCLGKGERGRKLVIEMIAVDDEDRDFFQRRDYLGWKAHLKSKGWPDIREHALHRLRLGQIDILSASEQVDGLAPRDAQSTYQQLNQQLALTKECS